MGTIRLVDEYRPGLREFLLSNGGLSKIPDRGENNDSFSADYNEGLLASYDGTYVAYHKGILIGHYTHREPLIQKVREVHGTSSLTVYLVIRNSLESSLSTARSN